MLLCGLQSQAHSRTLQEVAGGAAGGLARLMLKLVVPASPGITAGGSGPKVAEAEEAACSCEAAAWGPEDASANAGALPDEA